MKKRKIVNNIKNRTIYCHDNIDVLRGINSNSIDLIYLDPPFNKKKNFSAPIGTSAEGAEFSDIFKKEDLKNEWLENIELDHYSTHNLLNAVRDIEGRTLFNYRYLTYMAIRLIECHRILKETGSIYLHCDMMMSHYLKLILDSIFKEKNFLNEIIWHYGRRVYAANYFQRNHDCILVYAKKKGKHTFNKQENPDASIQNRYQDREKKPTSALPDVWTIPTINVQSKERIRYPTQKPLELLKRIIKASSNKGDMVLDPFCGCATAPIAAESLERNWIGIDISSKAFELVKQRLKEEIPPDLFRRDKPSFSTKLPKRTDLDKSYRDEKFVYVMSNKGPSGGEYYVGIASDVSERIKSYNKRNSDKGFKIEFKFKTHRYREIEKFIHDKYKGKRGWVKVFKNRIIRDIKNYGSKKTS